MTQAPPTETLPPTGDLPQQAEPDSHEPLAELNEGEFPPPLAQLDEGECPRACPEPVEGSLAGLDDGGCPRSLAFGDRGSLNPPQPQSMHWTQGPLADGLRCYCSREFFAAHEHWEDVWRSSAEPDKTFLQALIQITVAMHHFHQRNVPGATSLLRRALHKLERYPAAYAGIALAPLRQNLRIWLEGLDREGISLQLPIPDLRPSANPLP